MASNNSSKNVVELSIIVLSYNTCKLTLQTLDSIFSSLKSSSIKFEVIVLDNASKDDTLTEIIQRFAKIPALKLVKSNINLGYSKGNNEAVRQAKGKYLLFLNSDIIVQNSAIDSLLDFYSNNQDCVHFVGGKLLNSDGTAQPPTGPFYTLPVVFAALFLRGDYWGLTRSSPQLTRNVDWVSGACIMTTRAIFQSMHGFDEEIFMYMEEIDLLYRGSLKKYNTYFFPKAKFVHLGSASSQGKTFPILQVYEGFLYFYKKHYSARATSLLRLMLQLKAHIALVIGKLTKNGYLTQTYEKALRKAQMA